MTDNLNLDYIKTDEGYCRVYYRNKGTRNLYCFQNDGSWGKVDFVLYRCTSDGEPEYPIAIEQCASIEIAPKDTKTGNQLNDFISNVPRNFVGFWVRRLKTRKRYWMTCKSIWLGN